MAAKTAVVVNGITYIKIPNTKIYGKQAYIQQSDLVVERYDTGGYTGDWGSEGRLAMLHQKELVLNAADTENMLTAIEIVRELAGFVDRQVAVTEYQLAGKLLAQNVNTNRDILQQEVTIHAEFPNVQNHNEIELALSDLVNRAAQYANEW